MDNIWTLGVHGTNTRGFPINQVSYNEDQSLIIGRDYLSGLTQDTSCENLVLKDGNGLHTQIINTQRLGRSNTNDPKFYSSHSFD